MLSVVVCCLCFVERCCGLFVVVCVVALLDCSLFHVACLLFLVCCVLCVIVCGSFFGVGCLLLFLFVVCCLLFVVDWLKLLVI